MLCANAPCLLVHRQISELTLQTQDKATTREARQVPAVFTGSVRSHVENSTCVWTGETGRKSYRATRYAHNDESEREERKSTRAPAGSIWLEIQNRVDAQLNRSPSGVRGSRATQLSVDRASSQTSKASFRRTRDFCPPAEGGTSEDSTGQNAINEQHGAAASTLQSMTDQHKIRNTERNRVRSHDGE
eukprot:SAG31_NODE_10037_length_1192_cov_1.864593_1_plen_188_part_00